MFAPEERKAQRITTKPSEVEPLENIFVSPNRKSLWRLQEINE